MGGNKSGYIIKYASTNATEPYALYTCVNCGGEAHLGGVFEGNFLCPSCYADAGDIIFILKTALKNKQKQIKKLKETSKK